MSTVDALAIRVCMLQGRLWKEHASGTSLSRCNCIKELTSLVYDNAEDSRGVCVRAELPITLLSIMQDGHTYKDPGYCLRVVDLFAYIIAPACFGHEPILKPAADLALARGANLWQTIFSMRREIATGTRENAGLRVAFARLIKAYNNLYIRGEYPTLLDTHFGHFVLYAWVNRVTSGTNDTALQTFYSLCRTSTLSERNSFYLTAAKYCGGADAFANRFKYDLSQADLTKEHFVDCTRALSVFCCWTFGEDPIAQSFAENGVLESLYDALRKQTVSLSKKEEWNAIRELPVFLWATFRRTFNPSPLETNKNIDYLLFFMSRGAMYCPIYDCVEGVNTDEWLQLFDDVRKWYLTNSMHGPNFKALNKAVQCYWKSTAEILNDYITRGEIPRSNPNMMKILDAWNEMGHDFGLETRFR
ncbi:hypothetical protein DENSPDRAFT_692527 [Dentipellis sp. KUC8613]|nr:hypothetical protein DENSPDRAFT_692527 [Dentipellis sp. KUC8613]